MNYQEALDYIMDLDKYGSRMSVEWIGTLLDYLGNPHRGLKYLHVGGTNGKGSTSSYLANCLQQANYKVGLFTSPYLEKFNERVQINGENIPDDTLARLTGLIKEAAEKMVNNGLKHPTTFEMITTLSFLYFQEENVDYVVFEVGLGGKYDATNVIETSLASIITTLDYDHVETLGNTLGEIAYQKAGIIKENGIVISYPQEEEALNVLKEVSKEMNAEFYLAPMENIVIKSEGDFGSTFDYKYENNTLDNLEISMIGEYQIYNAALAITTLLVLREKGLVNISNEEIYKGLKKTKWKGRLEVLKRNPTFLIDGAHNVQGINHLAKALNLFKYDKLILGVAMLKDKDYSHMIELLAPMAHKIVATEVAIPRKLCAEDLANEARKYNDNVYVEKDIEKAIHKAYELASENDLIMFGGSLYLIGTVRTLVNLL